MNEKPLVKDLILAIIRQVVEKHSTKIKRAIEIYMLYFGVVMCLSAITGTYNPNNTPSVLGSWLGMSIRDIGSELNPKAIDLVQLLTLETEPDNLKTIESPSNREALVQTIKEY